MLIFTNLLNKICRFASCYDTAPVFSAAGRGAAPRPDSQRKAALSAALARGDPQHLPRARGSRCPCRRPAAGPRQRAGRCRAGLRRLPFQPPGAGLRPVRIHRGSLRFPRPSPEEIPSTCPGLVDRGVLADDRQPVPGKEPGAAARDCGVCLFSRRARGCAPSGFTEEVSAFRGPRPRRSPAPAQARGSRCPCRRPAAGPRRRAGRCRAEWSSHRRG